jgi:hypothetical protein
MRLSDEDVLRATLAEEFGRIAPAEPPVDDVLRRGRAARGRRHTAIASGAVVVAVGAALLGYQQARVPAPAGQGRHAATVDAPHRDATGEPVWSGSVNGKRWSATVDPRTGCVLSFGSCPVEFPDPTDEPLEFSSTSDSFEPDKYIAMLRADTARVEVVLRGGERLSLQPLEVGGKGLVLFETPHAFGMESVTAFAADGTELGYSIPFNQPDSTSMVVTWYRPGETPTQPEASGQVASGTVDGHRWSVEVRIGPFGVCFLSTGTGDGTGANGACNRLDAPAPMAPSSTSGSVGGETWHYSEVDGRIDHIDAVLSDGTTTRVTPTRLAGRSFASYVLSPNIRVLSTTAYDSTGRQLATGNGDTTPK